ncbi:PhnD/SsuA/transferrin family substrate-binding protein [Ectothiorhodospiraceae bacterium 2226]|nr:PhnD/SsuA/transferrin family substrate-binding protein [Ectothiorhodospiraceae bacterium 2226]
MNKTNKLVALGCLLWILSAGVPLAAAPPASAAPLEVGILPYLSARGVIQTYEPLREGLQRRLGRPVIVVSAPNLATFLERTQRGDYAVVITAAHLARLAQRDAGYVPQLATEAPLGGLLVSSKARPFAAVGDLAGETVLAPDPLALVTLLGRELLEAHGLTPDRGVALRYAGNHAAAALAVTRGEAGAAIIARGALPQLPREAQQGLQVIAQTREAPQAVLLTHATLSARDAAHVRSAVLAFAHDTIEGREVFGGWECASLLAAPSDLSALDGYVERLREAIDEGQQL